MELERKISGSDDGSNAVIEHFKSYAGITALTREISIDLLHSVKMCIRDRCSPCSRGVEDKLRAYIPEKPK